MRPSLARAVLGPPPRGPLGARGRGAGVGGVRLSRRPGPSRRETRAGTEGETWTRRSRASEARAAGGSPALRLAADSAAAALTQAGPRPAPNFEHRGSSTRRSAPRESHPPPLPPSPTPQEPAASQGRAGNREIESSSWSYQEDVVQEFFFVPRVVGGNADFSFDPFCLSTRAGTVVKWNTNEGIT